MPFLHEMVSHLASRPARPREFVVGAAPPGEPGPARLPGAAGSVALNVDTRESAFAALTDEAFRASVDRLARAGESAAADSAARQQSPFPEESAAPEERGSAPPEEAAQHLWRYLLMGLALVLVAEGLLSARMG